jgi:putative transposase
MFRYKSQRITDDAPIRRRLEELAAERRRFGYRRLHVLLRREGIVVNIKRIRRIYREANLQKFANACDDAWRSAAGIRLRSLPR